ncbi:MAG: AAA family ATPase [Rhodospirillales bacterium]|nr:AAA family ATPase [Rhodospirillales bacterium]
MGLVDVLLGRSSLAAAIRKDPISPLHLLLSQQETQRGLVALPRDKLQTLLNTAKKDYDVIVIDSPPLFAVSDPQILMTMADVTILIVRWGRTSQKVVNYALELVRRASGQIAGVVLSRVRLDALARYGEGDAGYYGKESQHYYSS